MPSTCKQVNTHYIGVQHHFVKVTARGAPLLPKLSTTCPPAASSTAGNERVIIEQTIKLRRTTCQLIDPTPTLGTGWARWGVVVVWVRTGGWASRRSRLETRRTQQTYVSGDGLNVRWIDANGVHGVGNSDRGRQVAVRLKPDTSASNAIATKLRIYCLFDTERAAEDVNLITIALRSTCSWAVETF